MSDIEPVRARAVPADAELDALVKRLNELYVANGTDYVQHAANTIQSLRQQVAELRAECLKRIGVTGDGNGY